MRKAASITLALVLTTTAFAADLNIQLSVFPEQIVADGRSTTIISITARQRNGSLAADGTRILLTTTLGTFRESIVTTASGQARAILIAGSVSGIAKITAVEAAATGNPSVLEVEMVKTKADLSSGAEPMEIESPEGVEYLFERRLATAYGANRGVRFQSGDLSGSADSLQYNLDTQELRGKNVELKWKGSTYQCTQMLLDIKRRRGVVLAEYDYFPLDSIRMWLWIPQFVIDDGAGGWRPTEKRRTLSVLSITPSGLVPRPGGIGGSFFDFERTREGEVGITEEAIRAERPEDAKLWRGVSSRMVIIPRRQVQFENFKIYQGEVPMSPIPRWVLDLNAAPGATPLGQVISVNQGQLALDYPQYLSLGTEATSALRLRVGPNYSRALSSGSGTFIDYEQNWFRPNGNQGSFGITGIGREDFSLGFRQFSRLGPKVTASYVIETPQIKSLISSASLNSQLSGFQFNLGTNNTRAFAGTPFDRQDYLAVLEKDPIKVGKLPIQMFFGLNALYNQSRSATTSSVSSGIGTRVRLQSLPLAVGKGSLQFGGTVSQLSGRNLASTTTTAANIVFAPPAKKGLSSTFTYDYSVDGISERSIGRHRLSAQMSLFSSSPLSFTLFSSRSLDADRTSLFGDLWYRTSPKMRMGYLYTFNRFSSGNFFDDNWVLGYRFAPDGQEFGLVYSRQTKRIGIALLSGNRI